MIEQKDIREIRKKYGLTQEQLAKMLHVAVNTVKRYESCTRKISNSMLDLLSYKVKELQKEQKAAIL